MVETKRGRIEECETEGETVTEGRKETFGEAVVSGAFLQTLAMAAVVCAYAVGKIVLP